MVAVPAATPVTVPPVEIVAIPVLLLLHVPPAVASVRVELAPTHACRVPPIAAGIGSTVNVAKALQPSEEVYVIVTVPAETPVTVPPVLTVAVAELLLLQLPPVVASLSVVLLPSQTAIVPVIAFGNGSTVNVVVV